ncbi:dihydrolipoyl dehydrogenase [Vulcanibacillus modesticaldus]|uniref:Dihydrolipoyl dehydrogenase n=1 Tax=Vulcanibacillus modesticaldus TaxID=337097 RepID=A0A1D2YRV8_9BACI|nr:dihydrolipoyl dehydrogenase [Vulcanibacillus modesticaldus]OEF95541.1 dihydrolipoyl dehydrogenase [Vulcanibacillus modesticaldus]
MIEQKQFDVVFIGAGPGGYVAAIRAAQLGLKVAVIEKDKVGGTCLHRGCIPTKALLRSAEIYRNAKEGSEFGINIDNITLNFTQVQNRKQQVVDQLKKGIEFLFKKNKVTLIEGYGRIENSGSDSNKVVRVETADGEKVVSTKKVIIATGSKPKTLPGLEIDGKYIITSDEALEMEELPKSMIIVGGGVIGMEWASLLNDFGVEVTVVEFLPRILPLEDSDVSKDITRTMKKRKVKIHTGTMVLPETIKIVDGRVELEAKKGEKMLQLSAEKVLVSVGRVAMIDNIGLENTKVEVEKGVIKVNEFFQTTDSNIYAIGDVIGGLQLAHVASHEGIVAVEHIAGKNPKPFNYLTVSKCTFTHPEVASVGLTEDEAKEKGYEVKVGKFQFRGIGKALVHGEVDGFIKLVVDQKTNTLLGAHMVGPHVTDMISEAGLAKVLEATAMDIAHTIHPHPTLAEAIMEAALDVDNEAIHA